MGYTNYIENEPTFNDKQWAIFTEACRELQRIADKKDSGLLEWFFDDDAIGFNNNGIETAIIYKDPTQREWTLNFCKTYRRTPDVYVKALFTLAKRFSGRTKVSCDGYMTEYGNAYSRYARQAFKVGIASIDIEKESA